MSYPIAQLDFPPTWQGLYARPQQLPEEDAHLYASDAYNVEFYGSVIRKRPGTYLLNGLWDWITTDWQIGVVTPPPLGVNGGFSQVSSRLKVGDLIRVLVWAPGAHNGANVPFTIAAIDASGNVTFTEGPPFVLPAGSLVTALPDTRDCRIGGIFQARFRNGAQPCLVDSVSTTTGAFKLHLLGNRQTLPFDLYARMPKTTVASWGPVFNVGYLQSTEGLQVGDYIHFPLADEGKRNARVSYVSGINRNILLDGAANIVIPIPKAGDPVYFYPSTTPARVVYQVPVANPMTAPGSGKMSASHMGNRTIMAFPNYPPLRYAHSQSDTVDGMNSIVKPYQTFFVVKGFDASLVGRQVVLSDIGDPDGIGHVYLRTISAISGTQVTVTPPLPTYLSQGALVDVVSVSRVGLGAPIIPPTVAVGTGGAMHAGTCSVRVTFAINPVYPSGTTKPEGDAFVESEACQPSARVSVAESGSLQISNIPQPLDPRVTEIRIYRTAVGGDGIWYNIGSVPVGTTTFSEIKADVSLGAPLQEFSNYPPYETMEVVVEWPHAQRLMGIARIGQAAWAVVWSDGMDVLRSQVKPESWPRDNFLFIGNDSGDRPRGIAAFYDSMLVFCERSIWRIQGNPPDLVVEPVNFQQHDQSGIGIASHQAIVVDQNEVIFPGPDGVYLLNRFQGVATGFQSQRISRQIDARWDETYIARRRRAHAIFLRSRRQYRLFWPMSALSEDPDQAFVYQFDAGIDGDPHYWSEWVFQRGPALSTAKITASTVVQPEPGDSALFASVNECAFIGTVEGAVLGMDLVATYPGAGFTDHGVMPYVFTYTTMPFGPAGGLAAPALGRFLHVALDADPIKPSLVPSTMARDLEIQISTRDTPIFEEFELPTGPPPSFLIPADARLALRRLVLLARGQYHLIRILDRSAPSAAPSWYGGNDRSLAIHRMTYFFQRLPEATIPETLVQVEPAD